VHQFGKAINQSKCVASVTNKKDIGTIWYQTNKGSLEFNRSMQHQSD